MFHQPPNEIVDGRMLSRLFADASRIDFFPQFGCGLSPDNAAAMQTLLIASRYGVEINTMHLARQRSEFNCSQGLTQPLSPGEVRVIFQGADVSAVPRHESLCRMLDGYSVCNSTQAAQANGDVEAGVR